ncbi:hypothetical protein MCOR25_003399 [Pyricularia grisea]|nr:hypothetical protein MCOR25_003399 [Pyricularia grisea]
MSLGPPKTWAAAPKVTFTILFLGWQNPSGGSSRLKSLSVNLSANEIVANQTVGNAKSTLDQQRSMPERGTGG